MYVLNGPLALRFPRPFLCNLFLIGWAHYLADVPDVVRTEHPVLELMLLARHAEIFPDDGLTVLDADMHEVVSGLRVSKAGHRRP